MARSPRIDVGGIAYHVINRRVAREILFDSDGDYAAFEKALAETCRDWPGVRVVAYCLMPNHWHLVLWPKHDGELSAFMQRLTVTHMRRWHAHRGSAGTGPVYQGRFKSFPIEHDQHLLNVCRYVERNALRAGMVRQSRNWPWNSLAKRLAAQPPAWLLRPEDWPVEMPADWEALVDEPQTQEEIDTLRRSVNRGTPFGTAAWQHRTAVRLKLQSSLRNPWRPKQTTKKRKRAVKPVRVSKNKIKGIKGGN